MNRQAATDWCVWHPAPEEPAQDRRAVQVWCCDLGDTGLDPFCDHASLSEAELERASRLKDPSRQELFRRQRALQRYLLGQFTGSPPRLLRFEETDTRGKPRLVPTPGIRCEFNLSHSENIFALAVAEDRPVGVDVEIVRPDWNWKSVAAMLLDESCQRQLADLPEREQARQFLRFWTLYEAFSKAIGAGIAGDSTARIPTGLAWDRVANSAGADGAPATLATRWVLGEFQLGSQDLVVAVVADCRPAAG